MKISDIILAKIQEIISKKPKAKFNWHDSLYEKIQFISLDDKGDVGEEITYDILKSKGCDVEYKGIGVKLSTNLLDFYFYGIIYL